MLTPSSSPLGPGRVKTRSDLVAMPSGARIFAFIRSACPHTPQKSWCAFTAQSFHTAWANSRQTRCISFSVTTDQTPQADGAIDPPRSEEHTSELQSHLNLVCRLLLEKK